MNDEEQRPPIESGDGGDLGPEPDLRSILSGGTRRRVLPPGETRERVSDPSGGVDSSMRETARPGTEQQRSGDPQSGDQRHQGQTVDEKGGKLPPVWPGDETKPWFRRERGLPPLPEKDANPTLDPDVLPTPLADIPTRGRAFGIGILLPLVISLILAFGLPIAIVVLAINALLFQQGQDIGSTIFRMRVLRENGDVAGFYLMWVRSAASLVSLFALGAGFLAAFSDPYYRTWHDRWLGTYVVKDAEEYNARKRSSPEFAQRWFWFTLILVITASVLFFMNGTTTTTEVTPT